MRHHEILPHTQTWAESLPSLIETIERGTAEFRALAVQDLTRMAIMADMCVTYYKEQI